MKHFIIKIPLDRQAEANAFCKTLSEGGDLTFTNELLDSTDKPAGYWCCWNMDDKTEADLRAGMPYAEFREYFDGENGKGVKITAEEYLTEKSFKSKDDQTATKLKA